MPIATDQQCQRYADERVRPRAEQVRALLLAMEDDKAALDDVYLALTQETPTWADARTDGPPHLLTPAVVAAMRGHAQLPAVLRACVRGV